MIHVYGDFETYSELNVRDTGAHRYASHPSTEALMFAYAIGDGDVELWIPGEKFPLPDQFVLHAHNAAFEYYIWNKVCTKRYGWPRLDIENVVCTAAKCAVLGLPRSLDGASKALGLKQEKDGDGHRVMQQLCKPRKPSKNNPSTRFTDEERLAKCQAYCIQDVIVEREIDRATPPMSASEIELWRLDFEINDFGIPIDVETCKRAVGVKQQEHERLAAELHEITDGFLDTPRQPIMLDWLVKQGANLPNLQAETIRSEVSSGKHKGKVQRVLEIRQLCSNASTAKYRAMIEHADEDNRVRGAHLYHGSHTGRWSAKFFQQQNIPQGFKDEEEIELAVDCIGDTERTDLIFGGWSEMLKNMLRGMLKAPDGKKLIVCDFAGIENRVLAWLADEVWLLDAIRSGDDVYKIMASRIYGVAIEDVTKEQRQLGKVAVLGLGYGMGAGTFVNTCESWGIEGITQEFAEEVKTTYRELHSRIVQFWWRLGDAAIDAVRNPKQVFKAGPIFFKYEGDWLKCRLPSGRLLWYREPHLKKGMTPWGQEKEQLYYWGVDGNTRQWKTHKTYGGKLAENCLAKGTKVLTDRGWTEIQNITLTHRIWDGHEFVGHCGVLDSGKQQVGELNGVYLTHEHKCWTDQGWKEASQIQGFNLSTSRLLPAKLPMGFASNKCKESTKFRAPGVRSGSKRGNRNSDVHDSLSIAKRLAYSLANRSTKPRIRTYDVLNCGPRNQFVVQGQEFDFVVHNCTQGLARDCLVEAMFNIDEHDGYRITFHVHDELVIECDEDFGTVEDVERIMCRMPAWADGCPIDAAGFETKRYHKD